MRDFLRFFLSTADQARVDPASVAVSDVAALPVPNALAGIGALQISFRITNPAAGAPQLRPLFPGTVQYLARPGAPGTLVEPDAVDLTPAGHATWRTLGSIAVRIKDKDVTAGLLEDGPDLEVRPTVAWYSSVRLTEAFMLTTLVNGLAKATIPKRPSGVVRPTDAVWPKHAVSRFLQGTYQPELRLGATAADDDVVRHAMPALEMAPDGQISLLVTMAAAQESPQDGPAGALDALAPATPRIDPAHPVNAGIPARHVYRRVRAHLLDSAGQVPDLVLADWPLARRYFPIVVTRTWKRIPNFSVQFPGRRLDVAIGAGPRAQHAIPAHGVVFVPQDPTSPPPALAPITVHAVAGPAATFLDGRTADAWRRKSGTTPVVFDLTAPDPGIPHIILRRPLRDEVMADTQFPTPGGMRCTYMSMRRSTRAFVDHRVTGGRLVKEGGRTAAATVDLMRDAWQATAAAKSIAGIEDVLSHDRPATGGSPGLARRLELIWRMFFPADVPAQDVDGDGNLHRNVVLDGGQMMYALWQTIETAQSADGVKRNFPNAHVGTGAPGAIIAVGLSSAYLVLPAHDNPDPAVLDGNARDMLDGRLTSAAVLQFWHLRSDYQRVRTRGGPPDDIGHSPMFRRYTTAADGSRNGMDVIDQFGGTSSCPAVGLPAHPRIQWGSARQDIWIAAQWDD